jgi:hypothetical protein
MVWWTEYDGLVDRSGIEWIVGWSVIDGLVELCNGSGSVQAPRSLCTTTFMTRWHYISSTGGAAVGPALAALLSTALLSGP